MKMADRIVAWNARQAERQSGLTIVLKGLVGFFLAGIVLAIAVPPLHARGVPLTDWMVWSTIVLMIVICVAPDLYRRYRRRAA